ncbi:MAG: S-layer homology domain-containing protein [Oscillospiraceae bacterium]|nr:S-layer homology domain-containing protein [Oscillospiraceae bacterium]
MRTKRYTAAMLALVLSGLLFQGALAAPAPLKLRVREQPVAAGCSDFYAIRADGMLIAWGTPEFGGDGKDPSFEQARELLPNAAAVYTSGRGATFAVDKEGGLYGINTGTVRFLPMLQGESDPDDPMKPVKIMDGVSMASTTQFHTLVLRQDGELWTQGSGVHGAPWLYEENVQKGKENPYLGDYYVKVMDHVTWVQAAGRGGLAVTADNELWGWGLDASGRDNKPQKLADNVLEASWNVLVRDGGWQGMVETTEGWRWTYDGGKFQMSRVPELDGAGRVSSGAVITRGGGLYLLDAMDGEYKQVMDRVDYADRGERTSLVIRYGGVLWCLTQQEDGSLQEQRLGTGFYGGTPGDRHGLDNFKTVNRYQTGQFTDVRASDWFADNVKSAYELGLMKGNSPATFAPNATITVAEAVTVAARVRDIYWGEGTSFTAKAGAAWYQPYVDYAIANGMMNTAPADYERPATRAELARWLDSALAGEGTEPATQTVRFTDVTEAHRDYACIMDLVRAGIMGGKGDGIFDPDAPVLRCEAAAMLSRAALPSLRLGAGG